MDNIKYTVKDKNGIHARPAGLIVKCAKNSGAKVQISFNGKKADCTKLFSIMQLGIKFGDEIEITAEGDNSEKALRDIENVMREAGL